MMIDALVTLLERVGSSVHTGSTSQSPRVGTRQAVLTCQHSSMSVRIPAAEL